MSVIDAFVKARAAHEQAQQRDQAARNAAIVAEVREILRSEYTAAKAMLPFIEGNVPAYRAFIESIGSPPNQQVATWLNNMRRLCDMIPKQMREAIEAYESVRAEQIPDPHQQEVFIRVTRAWLNSHNGALQSLDFTRKQIENWFLEWEQSDAAPRPTVVTTPGGGLDVNAYIAKQEGI